MNPERSQFLNLRHPPARLTPDEAAWYLGFGVHEITILVAARLLKPLGSPPGNGCKFFSAITLMRLREDVAWLAKACDAIVNHWRNRNDRYTVCARKKRHRQMPLHS